MDYVNEADLKEDVGTLYETGVFPDRLAKGLMEITVRILRSRKFNGYTEDWKEEMKGNALTALMKCLKEKRYDNTRPNTKVFSWATRVVFNQFTYTIRKKKSEIEKRKKYIEEALTQ